VHRLSDLRWVRQHTGKDTGKGRAATRFRR